MIRKTFIAALSMLGCLTFAMPDAEAGGGMGVGSGTSTCRLVFNGPNQPQIVSVTDDFISGDVVKIGALALLCDLPAAAAPQNQPPPGAAILDTERNAVACYLVSGADGARIPTTVRDPLTAVNTPTGTQGVTLGAIQFICVPAATTNP